MPIHGGFLRSPTVSEDMKYQFRKLQHFKKEIRSRYDLQGLLIASIRFTR